MKEKIEFLGEKYDKEHVIEVVAYYMWSRAPYGLFAVTGSTEIPIETVKNDMETFGDDVIRSIVYLCDEAIEYTKAHPERFKLTPDGECYDITYFLKEKGRKPKKKRERKPRKSEDKASDQDEQTPE